MEENRDKYLRQLGFVEPSDLSFPIAIVGAGGIGSWATLTLAKMGCSNITVIDKDTVEEHNTPSQIYSKAHIGMSKVEALQKIVQEMTEISINPVHALFQEFYKPEQEYGPDVLIVGVDSLEQRKEIWNLVVKDLNFDFFIDARMGGELLRIITVDPADYKAVEKYTKNINEPSKPHEEPCTARAIVYNTLMCGSILANMVKKYAKQEEVKKNLICDITSFQFV